MPFTERRQATRYRVALPVELEEGIGQTRDVSALGVFFETDQSLSPGASVHVSLVFGSGLRVHCEGQVVRVQPLQGRVGVAAAFSSYRFEEYEQPETLG